MNDIENSNGRDINYKVIGPSKWIWGTFLVLAAVFVLTNQLGGYVGIGIGSIIVSFLALAFLVQCIIALSFAPLPIPLAALYYIFQIPLGLPYLGVWTLVLVAVLGSVGLAVLLPRKHRFNWKNSREWARTSDENSDDGNNPTISIQFGEISRYLHSDCLETARLGCRFGSLEVFLDQTQLSPDGAEVICSCSFGTIEMFIPKHWIVIDNLGCTLGEVEHKNSRTTPEEGAPRLTITGNVTCGNIVIRYI